MPDKSDNDAWETSDVCLLSMPFPPLNQPSMALGLLKAAVREADISVSNFYPCVWFAEEIGLDVYVFISDSKQEFLAGEWAFAGAAFPDFIPITKLIWTQCSPPQSREGFCVEAASVLTRATLCGKRERPRLSSSKKWLVEC